jgi:cation diffusion facilitator family transporter
MISALTRKALDSTRARRNQSFAIRISLAVGFLMFCGKWYAYLRTGSAAILSDAAESVVHVLAVGFAAYSVWLSFKPADTSHPYGHDRISFFSAGVEGTLIILAAGVIIFEAIRKWMAGLELQNLGEGTAYVAAAGAINAILGGYLVWQGRRHNSIVLVANGKHVLTDSWTSLGVVGGLLLVLWTDWLPFDPLLAIAVALNILWAGGKLVRQSVGGLMDEGDPEIDSMIRAVLDSETASRKLNYHEYRYRNAGSTIWIEFHLLFPRATTITQAHWQATEIEAAIKSALPRPVNITTHLEPVEGHDETHRQLKDSVE